MCHIKEVFSEVLQCQQIWFWDWPVQSSWSDALIAKQQSQCHKCLSWTITSNNQYNWIPLKYVNILHMIDSNDLKKPSTVICKWKLYLSGFPWDVANYIAKILQTYYFGYSGHACLHTPKMIVSNCRNLNVYLHVKNKLHHSFLPWDITI